MKTMVKLMLLGCGFMMMTALPAYSDDPDAPPPPSEHGAGGNQEPVGAPIDGGLGILLVMGAVYGGKKFIQSRTVSRDT